MQIITSILTPFLLASLALSTPTPHSIRDVAHSPGEINIREIFADFVHIFYSQRNYSLALNKYAAPDLIQHNPTLANGRDAQVAAVLSITAVYDPSVQVVMVDRYGIGPAADNSNGTMIAPDTAGF